MDNMTAGEKRNRAKECSAKDLGGIYAELPHANSKEHRLKSVLLIEIQRALEGAFFVVDFLL